MLPTRVRACPTLAAVSAGEWLPFDPPGCEPNPLIDTDGTEITCGSVLLEVVDPIVVLHDPGHREYAKTGERAGVFTFSNDVLGPCHQLGTFDAAIRNACGIQPTIAVKQSTPTDYKLLVSW